MYSRQPFAISRCSYNCLHCMDWDIRWNIAWARGKSWGPNCLKVSPKQITSFRKLEVYSADEIFSFLHSHFPGEDHKQQRGHAEGGGRAVCWQEDWGHPGYCQVTAHTDMSHMSYVICHMSYVICHMSHVTCHMSHVPCNMSNFFFIIYFCI